MCFVAQRVTSRGVFQTNSSCDIAAVNLFDFLTVVRVHLQDTADTLFLALRGVEHVGTSIEHTGVNAEECQLTNIGVSHDLEGQGRERLRVAGRTMVFFTGIRVDTLDRRNIYRSRHIINDGIEQGLNALVAIGSTAGYRNEFALYSTFTDNFLDILFRDIFATEVFLHKLIIEFGKSFEQLFAVLFSLFLHVIRNFNFVSNFAEVVFINDGFVLNEVDDACERIFSTNRQLDSYSVSLEAFMHHVDNIVEICARDVHLVDISHTRNIVLLSLTPYGFSLRLNAAAGSQNCYGTIEHAQGTFYFYREVHVTRSINDVDTMVFPMTGRCSRRNRDTAFLFLNHPVHGSSAIK